MSAQGRPSLWASPRRSHGGEGSAGLPGSGRVDVGVLSRLLDDTTTSYKYFFLLALLARVERAGGGGEASLDRPIPLEGLAVDMVLGAWYPHGLCRLSLGPRDMLQGIVDAVDWGGIRGSWIAAGGAEWRRLRDLCAAQLDGAALLRFVPFRLLRPFFAAETRGLSDHRVNEAVATLADEHFQDRKPLYCFTDDRAGIILLHDWLEYLGRNAAILRGWARFKLAQYLQARNPAVAGIVDKLEPPLARSSLAAQSSWWREAIPLLGARARCVYSGLALEAADFSLDHYLPWSFVAHDRLWNLVPATRAINSAMSDRLPAQRYLDGMVGLQHAGIVAMREAWGETRWLKAIEQWIVDLRMDKGSMLDEGKLRAAYGATVAPLAGMAERQGFEGGWEFGP